MIMNFCKSMHDFLYDWSYIVSINVWTLKSLVVLRSIKNEPKRVHTISYDIDMDRRASIESLGLNLARRNRIHVV